MEQISYNEADVVANLPALKTISEVKGLIRQKHHKACHSNF